MATLEELAQKIQRLQDLEEIRNLAFDYWWYLDHKDWDNLATLFTDDMQFINLANGFTPPDKATWIEQGLKGYLTADIFTCHQGHQNRIHFIDDTHAEGIRVLRDNLYNAKANTEFLGRGWYFDKYRKEDGVWKIEKFALLYNMAKGGTNMAFGAEIGQALDTTQWDIGGQQAPEHIQFGFEALKEHGFNFPGEGF